MNQIDYYIYYNIDNESIQFMITVFENLMIFRLR